jgi:hypothetical protein
MDQVVPWSGFLGLIEPNSEHLGDWKGLHEIRAFRISRKPESNKRRLNRILREISWNSD